MRETNSVFGACNARIIDAYEMTRGRIHEVVAELVKDENRDAFRDYFLQTGEFLLMMMDHYDAIGDEGYFSQDFDVLLSNNHRLYEDITEPGYQTSFVNPTYAVKSFGLDMGRFLSGTAYLYRTYVGLVYEGRLWEMHELNELFLNTYSMVVKEEVRDVVLLSTAVRDHLIDGAPIKAENDFFRRISPEFDVYSNIVSDCDLTDLRYLFRYGMYIAENDIKQAEFVLSLPEEKKQKIADTYTEAYFRGFQRNNIPLDHKTSVHVIYSLGFESIVKKAYETFDKKGLRPFAFYYLRGAARPRLINTKPNLQMEYDHRFSNGFFMDDVYVDAMLEASANAMKKYSKEAGEFSGLALFEVYGQAPFSPVNHEANMVHDEATAAAQARLTRETAAEQNKYLPGDSYSFTINDYPLPSIGEDYEAIFMATIDVNTLEEPLYEKVQARMIDVLDGCSLVHVTGRNGNETDIQVALHMLDDPDKQTLFDNCTADVNVPVGEIYTSPVLKGTNGLLHVKEIYLTNHKYLDLKIRFEDGMITDYSCANFDTDEENRNFVRETLMHPYDTLPLGEFAIGTNTVAYMMARKFGINDRLPILIGEKTGPHFAIGDTCFKYAEDSPVYNSNGKEVVARENEMTCLRNVDLEKAYTNLHTDITIPYNELDCITGYDRDGISYDIIRQGRFVLEGTELLNRPFDEE